MVAEAYPAAVLGPSSPFVSVILALGGEEADGGIDDLVEDFRESTGIDLLSVTYAEMFTDIEALLDSGTAMDSSEFDAGMALYGEFDEQEIVASFERDDDLEYEVSDYRGFTVYLLHDVGGDPMSVSIINAETVLIGTASSVEAMLDVADGAAPSLSGELRQALDSLGERHMGFAIELPPELLEEMMGVGSEDAMPQMGLLGAMDISALTAPVNAMKVLFDDDGTMHITATSLFGDSEAATASREYSEGVVAMFGLMTADSPELQDFASSMEVGQSGSDVTFKMSISAQTIEELFASSGDYDDGTELRRHSTAPRGAGSDMAGAGGIPPLCVVCPRLGSLGRRGYNSACASGPFLAACSGLRPCNPAHIVIYYTNQAALRLGRL